SEHESRLTRDLGDIYVILPEFTSTPIEKYFAYPSIPEGMVYSSDINDKWLSVDELKAMIVR
ncbi:MAG: UDP-N-acetylglucosamine 4,6-dehydratase (inverting), partial [Candidatus Margulisiibacteriota bacterium]